MKRRTGLVAILALVMIFVWASAVWAAKYSDTADHWAYNQIERWSNIGIIQGCDGVFRPADPLTRGEMAVIINRIMNYQVAAYNNFIDLPGDAYYTDAILKANAAGVMLGDAGKVRPQDYLSREEAILLMGKAFGVEPSKIGSLHFTDKDDIASWASSMVLTMENRGYIKGTDGKLLPQNIISRAEVVKIIDNIIKHFITKAGVYNYNTTGTLLVNVPGVILKDMTVLGDLVVAAGVGEGEITLDNVKVNGNLVVKGGGVNSIHIKGSSNIGKVIINKTGSEVRVVTEDSAEVNNVIVADGSDNVILTGSFGDIQIAAPEITVNVVDADITTVKVEGEKTRLLLNSRSSVNTVTLIGTGNTVSGEKGAHVNTLVAESTASSAAVSGAMTLQIVQVKADRVSIDTEETKVVVAAGVDGTNYNGKAISAGTTVTPQVTTVISTYINAKTALGSVSIAGESKVGVELTAVLIPSQATATYQWQTASAVNGTFAYIAGAKEKTYTPNADDAGKFIRVVAKGTGYYMGTVKSTATAVAGITVASIDLGTSNLSMVISVVGDAFVTGATDEKNWIIDPGTTGLVLKTIALQGEAETATAVTVDFEGTAAAGILSIKANTGALASGVASNAVSIEIANIDEVDKEMLIDAISAANSNAASVTVSLDGVDVLPADMWVVPGVMDAYLTAIADAQAVIDKEDVSQTEVDDALAKIGTDTNVFNNYKAAGKIEMIKAASFVGDHIVTNLDINANGINMVVSPMSGYQFYADKPITAEIKKAIIDSMEFDYTYGLVDQNTGAIDKDASLKTNLTNLNNITTPYYAKTKVSLLGFSDAVIAWLRKYDDTQDANYKLFAWYQNEEYLSDRGRILAAGLAVQDELNNRSNVEINEDGNLVISCDNNGFLKNFTNVIRLVNGNQKFVFGDLPVSLIIPADLVEEGVALKTTNTFDILEIKSHIEIWQYVDDFHAGETGVAAVNTIYDNGGSSVYTPAYAKTHYIQRVAGDVLTEADIRSGGTLGPNGSGNKLIKVVVDGRTGPTWWAFKKPDAQFIYNAFRTNIEIDDYTLAANAQTPQDNPEWLKTENKILIGGPLAAGAAFNGFSTTNIYLFNTSADNRFDEFDVHDMWYMWEMPTIEDFNIDRDLMVYVNQLCGMTGGSGGGGSNPQGSPFWGMDGRCSFTIHAAD